MNNNIDILDHAFVRMPCNACGKKYEIPLRDILLSHTTVVCGCPVRDETECPPVFQVRLFDRETIKTLSEAWEKLAARAALDGGELVLNQKTRIEDSRRGNGQMADQNEHLGGERTRQPVSTSGTLLSFDLAQEVAGLKSEQPWQAEHTAKTIVKYSDLRVVVIALKAGGRLKEHRTAGRLTIQCLSGAIRVRVEGQTIEMTAGHVLTLDHEVPHDVEASVESAILLTIALPK